MFELIRKAQKAKALNLRTTTAILPETIRDLRRANRAMIIQQEEERLMRIQETIDQVARYDVFFHQENIPVGDTMNIRINWPITIDFNNSRVNQLAIEYIQVRNNQPTGNAQLGSREIDPRTQWQDEFVNEFDQQNITRDLFIEEDLDEINEFNLDNSSMNLHIDDTQIQDINELASLLEGSTLNDTANSNNQEGSALYIDANQTLNVSDTPVRQPRNDKGKATAECPNCHMHFEKIYGLAVHLRKCF